MRLIGLDPGLRHTGWGVIDAAGNRLTHVADGVAHTHNGLSLAERLGELYHQLNEVLDRFAPEAAAVEETFVNKNPFSTLRLGMARGVVLLAPAQRGLPVFEYATNLVKKSIVGVGHADKAQVQMMVRRLLPGAQGDADASDALAVAICHAHHAATARAVSPSPPTAFAVGPSPRRGEGEEMRSRVNTLSPLGRGQGEGADPKRKPTAAETNRARQLRRDATDAEALLWRRLRSRQLENAKFRRQEPILGFTADFVCHERKLVIELDGGQHATRTEQDARRTKMLEQAGFQVVRLWNNDVFDNIDGVLESIRASFVTRGATP